jgi:hypothetical protein
MFSLYIIYVSRGYSLMGSIQECDTVIEYLKRIKSQLYGSSKTCYSADKAADDRKVL